MHFYCRNPLFALFLCILIIILLIYMLFFMHFCIGMMLLSPAAAPCCALLLYFKYTLLRQCIRGVQPVIEAVIRSLSFIEIIFSHCGHLAQLRSSSLIKGSSVAVVHRGVQPVILSFNLNHSYAKTKTALCKSTKRLYKTKSQHHPIFPGRLHPSIFGTAQFNYCVRNGNRWDLSAIGTDCIYAVL